jgi:ligand-binding sensor domain-containing protein
MNVFIDASGNIWCGVLGFGAIKYDGTNWVSYTPSNSSLTYADVENFQQDNNGKIWIGTFGQSPDGQNGGIYTLDGTNWRNIRQNNSSLLGNYINSISKAVTGEIWIGSTYYGTSFGGGLSIIKNPANPTSNGAIQTLTPDNSNLPYPWITDIKFDNNGNAWMGLNGYGIAIYNPSGITSVRKENSEKVIVDYSLLQNYPNPFNPNTTIKYSVPKLGFVSIKIYDVLGKEVAALVNENKPAGNYSVQFNANKLVSGIYFYKIESGSYTQTKKLVLLK